MSSFASWGLTLLALAVITGIAEMLLPSGKTKKAVLSVCSVICALAILTPLPKLAGGAGGKLDIDSVPTDESFVEYIDGKKRELFQSSAESFLREKGVEATVKVELDGFSVKTATVKFSQSGMSENGAHINKSEITKLIAEYFGIDKEAVMVYG